MGTETDEPHGARRAVVTYRGGESTPWRFSVSRTDDEIVVTQARGPPEQFDPVVERFRIEPYELGGSPTTFDYPVIRRVWTEAGSDTGVQSQRSEGRIFELLYLADDGWHLDRPEPLVDGPLPDTDGKRVGTRHHGVSVRATYLRSEDDGDREFTEERK